MFVMLMGVYDVDGLVTAFESILYERKQHSVFFVVCREKCAHMPQLAELRTR